MMRGRLWLVLGVIVGVAVAVGRLPYLAGAGKSLADTAESLVLSGINRLVHDAATRGAPKRAVQGIGAVIAVLLPGITALLLVIAAKTTLRIRAIVALLIVAVGAVSYVYHPHGNATGVLVLALALAGLAVAITGPFVAAPLSFGAGLIGAEFLPTLMAKHSTVTQKAVNALHLAIFNKPGAPFGLQLLMLIVAVLPFAWAARMVLLD